MLANTYENLGGLRIFFFCEIFVGYNYDWDNSDSLIIVMKVMFLEPINIY